LLITEHGLGGVGKVEILLRELRKGPKAYKGEDADVLSDLAGPDLRVDGPLRVELSALLVSGQLVIRGKASVDVTFRCVRCAESFSRHIEEGAVEIVVEVDEDAESEAGGDDVAVDLTPELREAIILAFPSNPLCGEDCKGLCPRCGCNRNKEFCSCRPVEEDVRWAGLNGLAVD
jgi:uncharacterized protein